jgi:hypothetical protein
VVPALFGVIDMMVNAEATQQIRELGPCVWIRDNDRNIEYRSTKRVRAGLMCSFAAPALALVGGS